MNLINYKKILKILIRLLKHLITFLTEGTQLDWPSQSEEDGDNDGLDWCQDLQETVKTNQ